MDLVAFLYQNPLRQQSSSYDMYVLARVIYLFIILVCCSESGVWTSTWTSHETAEQGFNRNKAFPLPLFSDKLYHKEQLCVCVRLCVCVCMPLCFCMCVIYRL